MHKLPENCGFSEMPKHTLIQRIKSWRREWDSNPRYARAYNGFRDRPVRPLRHPSVAPPGPPAPAPGEPADTSQCTTGPQARLGGRAAWPPCPYGSPGTSDEPPPKGVDSRAFAAIVARVRPWVTTRGRGGFRICTCPCHRVIIKAICRDRPSMATAGRSPPRRDEQEIKCTQSSKPAASN